MPGEHLGGNVRMPLAPTPLSPDRLYRATDPGALDFATTDEIAQLPGLIYQARAREAIGFGTCITQSGFNVFAVGDTAGRVRDFVRLMLDEAALSQPAPLDWVYVYNFADPQRPRALSLPAGRAPAFQKAVHDLIEELKAPLPAVFESEDYQKQRGAVEQAIQAKGQTAFAALNEKARAKNIAVLRTPTGFTMAPVRDGKIVPPAEFNDWPAEQQLEVQKAVESLEKDLEETLRGMPRLEKEQRDAVLTLERDTARFAIAHLVAQVKAAFADLPAALVHIDEIIKDLLENVQLFVAPQETASADPLAGLRSTSWSHIIRPRRAGGRGTQPDTRQSRRPRRIFAVARRAGHRFPADQGWRFASRQWRHAASRRPRSLIGTFFLGGAETCPDPP